MHAHMGCSLPAWQAGTAGRLTNLATEGCIHNLQSLPFLIALRHFYRLENLLNSRSLHS
jgi:hypothetical protein